MYRKIYKAKKQINKNRSAKSAIVVGGFLTHLFE